MYHRSLECRLYEFKSSTFLSVLHFIEDLICARTCIDPCAKYTLQSAAVPHALNFPHPSGRLQPLELSHISHDAVIAFQNR